MKKGLQILLFYAGIPAFGATLWLFLSLLEMYLDGWFIAICIPLVTVFAYILFRKRIDLRFAAQVNAITLIALSVLLAIVMRICDGSARGTAFLVFQIITFPFLLPSLFMQLADTMSGLLIGILATYAVATVTCVILSRCAKAEASESIDPPRCRRVLPYLVACVVVVILGAFSLKQYWNRPAVRNAGHGFEYMSGYSTTDFSDYMVYSEPSKLVTLDHQPDLVIEGAENMPIMDGAEACYPVYAAVAKAIYRDIDVIESKAVETGNLTNVNGVIVTFTNTVRGFFRLLTGSVDLLFGARPSKDQLAEAEAEGVALTVTPIGREGFVFFVEKDNPIDNLTSEQVRAIYAGEITNWKEIGGKDQKIKAFQRPKNSGSQSMMEYFMGGVPLMEPDTYEIIGGMLDVIQKVAQYANEDGAMGYSFRYFVEELNQENDVKLLSIDGVAPTLENIESGLYPLTVDLCLITRTNDPNPNVQKVIDFLLSEDGQEIIRRTGYAGLRPKE